MRPILQRVRLVLHQTTRTNLWKLPTDWINSRSHFIYFIRGIIYIIHWFISNLLRSYYIHIRFTFFSSSWMFCIFYYLHTRTQLIPLFILIHQCYCIRLDEIFNTSNVARISSEASRKTFQRDFVSAAIPVVIAGLLFFCVSKICLTDMRLFYRSRCRVRGVWAMANRRRLRCCDTRWTGECRTVQEGESNNGCQTYVV